MSQRTVVEFNHDYCHAITGAPDEFVRALRVALGSGSASSWEPLRRFGIRRAAQHHHSAKATVVVTSDAGTTYLAGFPGDLPVDVKAVAAHIAKIRP